MPNDQPPSLTGQTVDRRYEVKRLLGTGGMGEVYLALDQRTGGPVVLKAPWPGMLLDDPSLRKRFIREIRTMSRLDHPNIIKVYDVVEHEGRPVAVMQYLSGGDLEAQTKLPVDKWLPQIASALDYLHLNKLVHRDVKPANIFFDSHRTPYLGDFGIVKPLAGAGTGFSTLHGGTQTGFALGTPKYMSPEAVEGRELDGRSDQYALAIIVYERLAGRMPFDGETPAHIFAAHLTAKPRPLSEIDANYGEAISGVLSRAPAKRLEERFLSAGVMEDGVVQSATLGTPQGGMLSPLLANIALNFLDWHLDRLGFRFVRYADDFVVLCRTERRAKEAREAVERLLQSLGLSLNAEKTRVTTFRLVVLRAVAGRRSCSHAARWVPARAGFSAACEGDSAPSTSQFWPPANPAVNPPRPGVFARWVFQATATRDECPRCGIQVVGATGRLARPGAVVARLARRPGSILLV